MSRRSIAKNSVHVAMKKLGGARSTQVQRKQKALALMTWCFENGYCVNSIKEVTAPAVNAFFESLKVTDSRRRKDAKPRGCSVATLHNYLASIRAAMQALGASPDALGITAKLIGLAPKSRKGTKKPVTDEIFEAAIQAAMVRGEQGLAIVLKLERYLGLRGLEALMNSKALVDIAQQIKDVVEEATTMPTIPVIFGTKGGKIRMTVVIQKYLLESISAIEEALNYARSHDGFLIEGKKKGLKFARARYRYSLPLIGLKGAYSAHSLRYRYVCDKILEMVQAGYPRDEVLTQVSKLIGHGPGRGRMITLVYGSSVVDKLPATNRRRNLASVLEEVRAMAVLISEYLTRCDHPQMAGDPVNGLVVGPFGTEIRLQSVDKSWLSRACDPTFDA